MDAMYANYYTREVMVILIREFASADEEMKKITLKVVKQCVATDGVEPDYIRQEVSVDLAESCRCSLAAASLRSACVRLLTLKTLKKTRVY